MQRTRQRLGMALTASALGFVLALVPTQFGAEQAHAAISPEVPAPLNVLPSSYRAAAAQGMYSFVQQAIYAAAAQTNKAQAAASVAVKAGTGTVNEAQLVAQMVSKFKGLPATTLNVATKVVGPASWALVAGQFGFWYGTRSATAMGFDTSSEALCTSGHSGWNLAAELVNGADCSAFFTPTPEFIAAANSDIIPKPAGWAQTPTWSNVRWGSAGSEVGSATITMGPLTGPTFGAKRGDAFTFSGSATISGSCVNAGNPDPTSTISTMFLNTSTGTVHSAQTLRIYGSTGNPKLGSPCSATTAQKVLQTAIANVPTNYQFDHFLVHPGNGLDGNAASVPSIAWYPEGHAAWTPGTDANPERNLECVIHFTNGESRSAMSSPFYEGDEFPPIVCPADYPPNWLPETFETWEVGGGQRHLLDQQSTTPEFQEIAAVAPDCLDGSCVTLLHDRATGVSCYDNPVPCADWFTDPDKQNKFECRYGANVVALESCTALAPTFKPGSATSDAPYGDPITGQPIPNPKGRAPLPGGVTNPEVTRDCFPSGWGVLNPVEWVMKPVTCAIEWAFVPRTSVVNSTLANMRAAWNATSLVKVSQVVGTLEFVPPNPSGCDGITVSVFFLGDPFQIMNACPGSGLETMAFWSRVFGNITVTVYGLIAVTRHLARVVGYGGLGESS